MAKFDRFLIAPSNTGLQTDLKPWLIPDDALASLKNAYVFRGRIIKRFGSRFMGTGWSSAQTEPLFSRLRINLENTDGAGAKSGTVPGAIFKVGQAFSVGTTIFTVVNGTAGAQAMLSTGTATGTYDTSNGNYVIAGAAIATPLWFYPAEPVMGLTNYSVAASINNQQAYAWDTQFSYTFAGGFWQRTPSVTAAIWHGGNLNFFWATNWQGINSYPQIMFATNFQVTYYDGAGAATDDPIWFYNSAAGGGATWTAAIGGVNGWFFLPAGGAPHTGPFIQTARLIVPFKNRLVLLNTVENDNSGGFGVNTNFSNRARYCHYGSPFAANAWYEQNQTDNAAGVGDGGGYVDAATEEEIISCEFIKDRLIVYFERSTWELAYTGNAVKPFTWQKINTELGSESQFSTVPFDKEILTIGNTGVHSCNGSNVARIDNKIPDEIFEISNKNTGVQRVVGIRDYFAEMVYWCFPSENVNQSDTYPNLILVYNYRTGAWALNDDCITMFGYFEQEAGITWASTTTNWMQSNFSWESGTLEAQSRQIIAGNMEGYVFLILSGSINTDSRNERAMQITNLTYPSSGIIQLVIVDHTLEVGDFVTIENAGGITISAPGPCNYEVVAIVNSNTIQVEEPFFPLITVSGTYTGGGNSARVSRIDILSKQWNPYIDKDRNVFVQRIDFGVTQTAAGAITVDYYPSGTEVSLIQKGGPLGTNAILGNNILETSPYPIALAPLEQDQELLWHPVYFQSDGTLIQIRIFLSDAQMINQTTAWSFFELQGMCLFCAPTTERLQ